MFNRLPGIGLDIGCHEVRLIWVEKKEAGLQLVKYGGIHTPPGTVEVGGIVDPETLGKEIGQLVKKLKLGGKRVVSAVGGQQIYFRNLIMPSFAWEELKNAVYYQAMKFLPIPLEEAALDIYPLRELELENGKHTELFFLAVRKQQVDNLRLCCVNAGLKLAVVEIEPLALYRVLGEKDEAGEAILSIGSNRSQIAVFNQGVPVFYRSINRGSSASYLTWSHPVATGSRSGGKSALLQETAGECLQTDLIRDIKGVLEYYRHSDKEGVSIKKIWLCSAGPVGDWEFMLSKELEVDVEAVNILPRLILPRHTSNVEKRELQANYQVALGLAAREVL